MINNVELQSLSNHRAKWEFIKYSIGVASRKYSKKLGIQKGNEKAKSQTLINTLSLKLSNSTSEVEINLIKDQLKEATDSLDKVLEDEAQSIIFRSRVKHVEEGEKVTGYHFRTIKENNKNANITELRIDSQIVEDKKQVNSFILNFYKTL